MSTTDTMDKPMSAAETEPKKEAAAPTRSKRPQLIALAVLAVGGLGLGGYYLSRAGIEATDDAQVEADIVSVPARVASSPRSASPTTSS